MTETQEYIMSFDDVRDREIVAIVCAWLCYAEKDRLYDAKYIVNGVFDKHPYRFVMSGDKVSCVRSFGLLSPYNLSALVECLRRCYAKHNTLETAFRCVLGNTRKNRIRYAHEGLCALLSTPHSGFPSRASNCTFYRYNLFLYWMTHVFKLWNATSGVIQLLPCSDAVFTNARARGIIRKTAKTSLLNATTFTNLAIEKYGDDYFQLYDLVS